MKVLFTDQRRSTLDGINGWKRGIFTQNMVNVLSLCIRRQQGVGGVMFWTGTVVNGLVRLFRVRNGVKVTYIVYFHFLSDHLLPQLKTKYLLFSRTFFLWLIVLHHMLQGLPLTIWNLISTDRKKSLIWTHKKITDVTSWARFTLLTTVKHQR